MPVPPCKIHKGGTFSLNLMALGCKPEPAREANLKVRPTGEGGGRTREGMAGKRNRGVCGYSPTVFFRFVPKLRLGNVPAPEDTASFCFRDKNNGRFMES